MEKARLHGRTVLASGLSAQAKAGIEKARLEKTDRAKNSSKKAAYSGKSPRRKPLASA